LIEKRRPRKGIENSGCFLKKILPSFFFFLSIKRNSAALKEVVNLVFHNIREEKK